MSIKLRSGVAAVGLVIACAGAGAGIINIVQDTPNVNGDPNVAFSGTIDYVFNGGTNGTLNISLTNTSAAPVGGFITGFVFNVGGSGVSTLLSTTNFASFVNLTNANGQPFGSSFVGGAALGGNWEGGGNPSNGIGIGQTGSFTFDVNGANAGSISSSSFLDGPYDFNFIVRFRGLANGGSSKAPAVPAPAGVALGAMAIGAGLRRRR